MAEVKLNKNEVKALSVICADCDELDGWGFTRPSMVIDSLAEAFNNNYRVMGGYLKDLIDKNLIDYNTFDDELWVYPEYFEQYC